MVVKGLIAIGLTVILMLGAVPFAGAAPAGPLAQVIEAAKKEGTVSAKLNPGFTQQSMYKLEKAIKDRYGVDLKIKFAGSTSFSNDVAESIMEQKAGAVPSYDLLTLSNHIARANKAGVLERVDWKPLLSEGTNPKVVHDSPLMQGGIIYYTTHFGLVYNPEKIKSDEAPKTLLEMGNPKWKGRVGIESVGNSWIRWAYIMGKEKCISAIRTLMKNGVIQGRQGDLHNRYLIGEIWMTRNSSDNLKDARDKGMPAAWQTLDFNDSQETGLVIRKGASHSNAAKLVALYLASSEGSKFTFEEAGGGNLHYSGNIEYDIRAQNQKLGIREVLSTRMEDVLEFYDSNEARQLEKELGVVLQGG